MNSPVFLKNKPIIFFCKPLDFVLPLSLFVFALVAVFSFFLIFFSDFGPKAVILLSLSTIVEFFIIFAYGIISNPKKKSSS